MSLLLAVMAAAFTALTTVTGVSIAPAGGKTRVEIRVDGPVRVQDHLYAGPDRLVVDLDGARQGLPQTRYSGIGRGGIAGLRTSQFRAGVVRVVLDLDDSVDYTVERRSDAVIVSFPNPGGAFQPWATGPAALAAAPDTGSATPGSPRQAASPAASPTASNPPAAADHHPAPRRAAAPAAPQQKPPITVSFDATPILDVLTTFADFSGRSIVAGEGVTGTVTAEIKNKPWDTALDAILQAHGLAAQEMESGIIQVEKTDKLRENEKNEEIVTRQFRINYIPVDSIVNAIKGLLSDRGKVTTSRNTNTLVVSDGRSVIDRLGPMIKELDVRTPQVTISAKLLFIDKTALQGLGIVYDLKDSRGNQLNSVNPGFADQNGDGIFQPSEQTTQNVVLLGGNSIAALGNAASRIANPTLQLLTSLVLGRHSLVAFIEALQTLSLSDIQATPVLTVMDNREANIQVGEQTPIRVIDAGATSTGGGGANVPRANVQMKNTGVILRVTPHVTGNQILLELHAERSNIAAAPSDLGVTFQTQQAETQVLVKDGETAVVGGLTIIEKSKVHAGIPILMNLPIIGPLFRNTTNSEVKRDLLIMVTPHILRDGES